MVRRYEHPPLSFYETFREVLGGRGNFGLWEPAMCFWVFLRRKTCKFLLQPLDFTDRSSFVPQTAFVRADRRDGFQ